MIEPSSAAGNVMAVDKIARLLGGDNSAGITIKLSADVADLASLRRVRSVKADVDAIRRQISH